MLKNSTRHSSKIIRWISIAVFVLIIVTLMRDVRNSLFFKSKERINMIYYGEETRFFSLGINDNLHYIISFFPDLRIPVPGGYGYYRVGALGKLVNLDNNPEIFKKSFSLVTNTFADYYFFPKKNDIYYGKEVKKIPSMPSFSEIFLDQSNAGIIDRIYIYLHLLRKRPQEFDNLEGITSYKKEGNQIFSLEEFTKKYQGYFYQKVFRNENKNVQILYNKSNYTAWFLGTIIEGNGIRVADVSWVDGSEKKCLVKEDLSTHSLTARRIALFFGCGLVKDKTGIYDIIFILGSREREWEI